MIAFKYDLYNWNNLLILCYRRVLILLDISVVKKGSEVKEKIGNPVQLKLDGTGNVVLFEARQERAWCACM